METKKGRVWAVYSPWNKSWHYNIDDASCDMSTEGWVLVKEFEVSFEVPPHEVLVGMTAAALKIELEKMRADHYAAEQRKEEVIRELLCLEAPKEELIND